SHAGLRHHHQTLSNEEFGDGIMSAIDFSRSVDRAETDQVPGVHITLNGTVPSPEESVRSPRDHLPATSNDPHRRCAIPGPSPSANASAMAQYAYRLLLPCSPGSPRMNQGSKACIA